MSSGERKAVPWALSVWMVFPCRSWETKIRLPMQNRDSSRSEEKNKKQTEGKAMNQKAVAFIQARGTDEWNEKLIQ